MTTADADTWEALVFWCAFSLPVGFGLGLVVIRLLGIEFDFRRKE